MVKYAFDFMERFALYLYLCMATDDDQSVCIKYNVEVDDREPWQCILFIRVCVCVCS